ncbi:TIGR02679 family protein [uncultured Pseudoflavonifractor sp.]|uniref:TIGR02679 family protein n=1 Tax=uncultured Pseudoflavonifractor sp. TaxID=1221379 RepID=UPI0025F51855|nr:TIGR02679 family protein [uncultured Pseudoflavonifractor sp.]
MREQVEACVAYFRACPAYHRILVELRKKYRRYGRPAGNVCLPDATEEEREAARRFFGRSFSESLRFSTEQFEAALQQTKFRGVCLRELLEAYFGEEIRTNREAREAQEQRLSAVLDRAAAEVRGENSIRWIRSLKEGQGGGYGLLRREAARAPEAAGTSLIRACRSMDCLESRTVRPVRLAVLSAEATSDPHALDSGTLSGKLFLHLLSFCSGLELPDRAEQRDALYYGHGILCDSISSLVTQVGLVLDAEGGEHPAYRLLRQRHEVCTLSLASLSGLRGARSPTKRAYLVENEMVFSQLCDRAAQFHSPLLCTSGQPSVAALRLLDLLADSGTELFYSGDFDGKGLSITAQLWARYPRLFHPWHMMPEDYARCRSDVRLSDSSLSLLSCCKGTGLEATADAVAQQGCDGYQELLLPQLERELTEIP